MVERPAEVRLIEFGNLVAGWAIALNPLFVFNDVDGNSPCPPTFKDLNTEATECLSKLRIKSLFATEGAEAIAAAS